MLGSGSAGNSALIATDHCKILVDGGLSARQLVLRLEQCGVTPEQLDGVVLTPSTLFFAVVRSAARKQTLLSVTPRRIPEASFTIIEKIIAETTRASPEPGE